MRKAAALVWLALVCAALLHVAWSARDGLPLQTDLMALLPAEEHDPAIGEAKRLVTERLSSQILFLLGHADPDRAVGAAATLRDKLAGDGVMAAAAGLPDVDSVRSLARLYYPHRQGLLADADRIALEQDRAGDLVQRALAQFYGIGGMADARLLADDPFQTFPAFLADLPFAAGRFTLNGSWPTVKEGGLTWVLLAGKVTGRSMSLKDQERFVDSYQGARRAMPEGVEVRRLGAVFYAEAGARQALGESSVIGTFSLVGTIILLLVVFRSAWPLSISVLAALVGILCALSVCLAGFGTLHAAVTIFGASLIGVTVDYAVHYCAQVFEPSRTRPGDRIAHVMPGIVLGLLTTLVGYLALALSPLPGLFQVAIFSAVGLTASFVTVVLWFPLLDRMRFRPMPRFLQQGALLLWDFWDQPRRRKARLALGLLLVLAAGIGATMLSAVDDIRRQQQLDPALAAEQADVRRLIGGATDQQFFLVQAADSEAALALEERLGERLSGIKARGGIDEWRSPARLVPSVARQRANAALRSDRLERPHLTEFRARIGLPPSRPAPAGMKPLRLAAVAEAMPLVGMLVLREGMHVVALDGVKDPAALRAAAQGLDGIAFVDPTADVTELLGRYRSRAVWMIAISTLFMAALLALRYGPRGAGLVLLPPLCAIVMTPALLALFGVPFTFFGAMALVMVLAMGLDFAVFCAEADGRRDPVTVLATSLATLTTLLSFGLMAFSQAAGIRSFGAVMLVGMTLAFLLSPFAGRVRPKRSSHAH